MTTFATTTEINEAGQIAGACEEYRRGANQLLRNAQLIRQRLAEGEMTNDELVAWLSKAAAIIHDAGDAMGDCSELGLKAFGAAYGWRRASRASEQAADGALALASSALALVAVTAATPKPARRKAVRS